MDVVVFLSSEKMWKSGIFRTEKNVKRSIFSMRIKCGMSSILNTKKILMHRGVIVTNNKEQF